MKKLTVRNEEQYNIRPYINRIRYFPGTPADPNIIAVRPLGKVLYAYTIPSRSLGAIRVIITLKSRFNVI